MNILRSTGFRSIVLILIVYLLASTSAWAEKKQEAKGQTPPAPEVTVIKTAPRDTPVVFLLSLPPL